MKPNLKDEPKEWLKSTLMTALCLAVLSSVLRWRHVLSNDNWFIVLALLGMMAICALWQPRWFRGYHRFSTRLGFAVSQFIGRIVLAFFFFLVLTPLGLILRLAGKDALQLKQVSFLPGKRLRFSRFAGCKKAPRGATTYWQPAKDYSPLDRLF